MGKLVNNHSETGIMITRVEGALEGDDLEQWRDDLAKFIKGNRDRGACGVLVDVTDLHSISVDAFDCVAELLSDPEEVISDIKMRFAFIGVKPFAQRFFREVLPVEDVKHIRARYFHEVSEEEGIAWLKAMVASQDIESGQAVDKTTAKDSVSKVVTERDKGTSRTESPDAALSYKPLSKGIEKALKEIGLKPNPPKPSEPKPVPKSVTSRSPK